MDWNNKQSVCDYAKQLAGTATSTQVVYKHPDRNNYNLTHESRTDLYQPTWVVLRVPPTKFKRMN